VVAARAHRHGSPHYSGNVLATYPTSLSPSRSNDFLTCPLLYRYRAIDNLPEEPSPAAIRGTLVHRVLEDLFGLAPQARTINQAQSLLAEAFADLERTSPIDAAALIADAGSVEQVLEPALPLLDTYFALEDPTRLEPHSRELAVEASVVDGFSIRGFVDRVDIAPDGAVRIVDYKTGRAPSQAFEAKAMFQMRFYALTWWRMTTELPAMLQLMYLGSGHLLRYQPDDADLRATERKILAIRDAISQAGARGDFRPTPSRLCGWCSFKAHCPEFGGTPLPLPDRSSWGRTLSPGGGRQSP
jgi:putative RecB family exonuclease